MIHALVDRSLIKSSDKCQVLILSVGLIQPARHLLRTRRDIRDTSFVLLVVVIIFAGPPSLWHWSATGNILPWAVVQFGGMALLIGLSFVRPEGEALSLIWVVIIYALAKLCEHFDHQIFELSAQWVSGHTLKHLMASLVICAVINALVPSSRSPQSKP